MTNKQFQAIYLKQQILQTKKRLGKECTFLAFETVGDRLFFKAKISKDRIRVQINKNLEDINQSDFEDLFKILNERMYDNVEITL